MAEFRANSVVNVVKSRQLHALVDGRLGYLNDQGSPLRLESTLTIFQHVHLGSPRLREAFRERYSFAPSSAPDAPGCISSRSLSKASKGMANIEL